MKHTEQYTNRYGDVFAFTYQPETDTILWEVVKGSFDYCRYGWEKDVTLYDNRYTMVDPSGGPYISSGMESTLIPSKVRGRYVDYMSLNLDDNKNIASINIHLKVPQI